MSRSVSLQLLRAGACRHLECMAMRGGRMLPIDFPALCGLIHHHTRGWILYDTGYADHFFTATERYPERLYRKALPVKLPPNEAMGAQLAKLGLARKDISTVIISHYHGDHIAGLRDYPNARFIALREDTRVLETLRNHPLRATLKAQLHQLLPPDFFLRLDDADGCPMRELPKWAALFEAGFDLLGDGSLLGIPLPGHTNGQLGLFIPNADGRPVFLVADACWSLPACREGRLPSRIAQFVSADSKRYNETFFTLRSLLLKESAIELVPSHCSHAWNKFVRET